MTRKYFSQPAELMASDLEQATYFVYIDPYDGHPVLHMQLPPEPSFPRVPRWFSFFRSEQGLTWCKDQDVADMIEHDDQQWLGGICTAWEIRRQKSSPLDLEFR